MGDKTKNIIVTVGFSIVLALVLLLNIIDKDKKISNTERRKLAQFPEITLSKVIDGDVSEKFENYAMDQFIQRDSFRKIKSLWSKNIFRQKDNNKLFLKDNAIYKIEYPLDRNNVKKSTDKINKIYDEYLKNMNVYYAIIPDKNYYLNDDTYLKMDYDELKKVMQDTINNDIKYIDIWNDLTLDDYYRTDTHWKQENLDKVVNTIERKMNLDVSKNVKYNTEEIGDFYGVYYGQLGLDIKPDKIKILSNEEIENCKTYNVESKKENKVYDRNKFNTSSDKYDIFVSGATPIITIENPNSSSNKELLLFRDSYGSSIAPLLIKDYSKITLIDVRYISSSLLKEFIDFENQDVLFLYSTLVLNQNILK